MLEDVIYELHEWAGKQCYWWVSFGEGRCWASWKCIETDADFWMVTAAFWPHTGFECLEVLRCFWVYSGCGKQGKCKEVGGKKAKFGSQDHHQHHWPLARWWISPSNVVLYIVLTNKRTFPKRAHCCCGLEIWKAFAVLGWAQPQTCPWSQCFGFSWQADSLWSFKEKFTGLSSLISLLKADSVTEETKCWLLSASLSLLYWFIIQLRRRSRTVA